MDLRAFIYGRKKMYTDMLYRLVVFFGKPAEISKDDAEKRERMIQTYLVVFGLLLSYNGDPNLQGRLMMIFIPFLIASLFYYSFIMRSRGSRLFFNILALGMGLFFSVALATCYFAFVGQTVVWFFKLTFVVIVSFFVTLPLLV